jgi:hypothetical protein
LFKGGDVLNFDELKWELVSKVKTINWKQPVLILFLVFVAMELLAPIALARWGARWGGAGGWGRWGGWGGGWGGWGRPWNSGWGGWW